MNNPNLEIRHCNQEYAFGIWDLTANDWKIKPQFGSLYAIRNGEFYICGSKQNNCEGLICGKTGTMILQCKYKNISLIDENSLSVSIYSSKKIALFHLPSQKLSKFIFTDVSKFSEGYAFAKLDDAGKWGVIDEMGNKYTYFIFDDPSKFDNHFAKVLINGKTHNIGGCSMKFYTDEEVSEIRAKILEMGVKIWDYADFLK